MNKILNFTVLLIILLISCTKEKDHCGDTQTTYRYISKESLEKTQYFTNPAFDTISFTSNKGDTLIFVKTKTDSTWFDYEYYNSPPGCPPTENQRNLEITNSYKTIKGTGSLKVKHSKETITEYDNNSGKEVIEIYFLENHFYFFETVFNDIFYKHYIGTFNNGDTTFKNVFFEYTDFKQETGVKGFMVPNFGMIEVKDTINSIIYSLIK